MPADRMSSGHARLELALQDATPEQVDAAVRAVWGHVRRARLAGLLGDQPGARRRKPARGAWDRGALRREITRLLAARDPGQRGLTAREITAATGWSGTAVHRELGLMEQEGLAQRIRPLRTDLWKLTHEGGT